MARSCAVYGSVVCKTGTSGSLLIQGLYKGFQTLQVETVRIFTEYTKGHTHGDQLSLSKVSRRKGCGGKEVSYDPHVPDVSPHTCA